MKIKHALFAALLAVVAYSQARDARAEREASVDEAPAAAAPACPAPEAD